MKLVLNIVLLVILALCIWGGFKRGLIGGIIGLLTIIISLIGANALASTYGREVVPALNPLHWILSGYFGGSGKNLSLVRFPFRRGVDGCNHHCRL